MANSPAKNISSLDSHTMVPTEAMLGRLTGACAAEDWTADAVATAALLPHPALRRRATPRGRRHVVATPAAATTTPAPPDSIRAGRAAATSRPRPPPTPP